MFNILVKIRGMDFDPRFWAANSISHCSSDYSDCINFADHHSFPPLFSTLKTPHFLFSHIGTVFPAGLKPAEMIDSNPVSE